MEETLANVNQTLKLTANKISEDISKALDARLKELNQTVDNVKNTIQNSQDGMTNMLSRKLEEITARLHELGSNRSSSYH
jgi:hypothetical protein